MDSLRTPPASVRAAVHSAMDAAIHTRLPTHARTDADSGLPWKPRGLLVTHLAEHKKAVNQVAVAGNGAFFATASNDETVKVWDCRRLEKDVTFRSRLTYSSQVNEGFVWSHGGCHGSVFLAQPSHACVEQDAYGRRVAVYWPALRAMTARAWPLDPATAVCMCGGWSTRQGLEAAPIDTRALWVRACRLTGVLDACYPPAPLRHSLSGVRRADPGEGSILEVVQCGSLLLYSTQVGRLHAWDLRVARDAWVLHADAGKVQFRSGCCL